MQESPGDNCPGSYRSIQLAMMVVLSIVIAVIAMILVAPVVLMIPVALVHLPALVIVVVVGMAPVSAGVRWPVPTSWNPAIVPPIIAPVAIDPSKTFAWHGWTSFVPKRWWCAADIHIDLAKGWYCE